MLDDSFKIRYKSVPLAVSFQKESYEPTEAHNHLEFEILLIESGECHLTVNDKQYIVKGGDMIFINPLEIHSIYVSDKEPYSHICICFDCSLIIDASIRNSLLEESLHLRHHITSENQITLYLKELFLKTIDSFYEDTAFTKAELISYISLIITNMVKNGFTDNQINKSKNTVFCAKALKYISEHYTENITSKEIASALSYNQSYFCRTFRKNFNKCFSNYLNMYRIAASRKLFETDKKTVTQIASECGFNSASYFTSCFKKYIGISPSEYKREN